MTSYKDTLNSNSTVCIEEAIEFSTLMSLFQITLYKCPITLCYTPWQSDDLTMKAMKPQNESIKPKWLQLHKSFFEDKHKEMCKYYIYIYIKAYG